MAHARRRMAHGIPADLVVLGEPAGQRLYVVHKSAQETSVHVAEVPAAGGGVALVVHKHFSNSGFVDVGQGGVSTDAAEEARIHATMCAGPHPHIVALHRVYLHTPSLQEVTMEMEVVAETLGGLIHHNHRLSDDALCAIFREALLALHHIHGRGYAHGDIKPENIGVVGISLGNTAGDRRYSVKVLDFGLARPIRDEHVCLTVSYEGKPARLTPDLCTVGYHSPDILAAVAAFAASGEEQAEYQIHIDFEIWALGVVIIALDIATAPYRDAKPFVHSDAVARIVIMEPGVPMQFIHSLRSQNLQTLVHLIMNVPLGARRLSVDAALRHPYFSGDVARPTFFSPARV